MNMQSMMAQAQKMQRDIMKKKEEINNTNFTGKSEWVSIVFNGNKELVSINIAKDKTIEVDDIEVLEDMIKLAVKDAFTQIDKEVADKMGAYGDLGGLF